MTNDEVQSAIEFLLKSQANFEVQLEKTNRQLEQTDRQLELTDQQLERTTRQLERTTRQGEETDRRLSMLADTQSEFIQTMLRHVEAQAEINADSRRSMKELAEAQRQTQLDLSELAKTVNGLVKTVYGNGNPPQV
ncbi:MAG TPA: hypothetical protein VGC87_04885 [Pyrinomonadaceae bacterium]|jgi:chromosome segregation ATPase